MNLHRLWVFAQVARHHGIAEAVRKMPYGIQQPAVSEQIKLLEDEVGAKLFVRRPFRLTREGRFLYAPLEPLIKELERRIKELCLRRKPHVRLGAEEGLSEALALPAIGSSLKHEPATGIDLQSGPADRLTQSLQEGEIDLAITTLAGKPPRGLACRIVASRPLALLVPKTMPIRSAEYFWGQKNVGEKLIAPADTHAISQAFQQGLSRGDVVWQARIKTDSFAGVAPMVAAGYGVGVTLALPGLARHPGLRVLPLAGFDPVPIACLWRRADTVRLKTPLQFIEQTAGSLKSEK